jgi:osmotically-inducible protein OsmY
MSHRRDDRRRGGERYRHPQFRNGLSQLPGTYPARQRTTGLGWARSGDVSDVRSQEHAPRDGGGHYDRTGQEDYAEGLRRFEAEEEAIGYGDRELGSSFAMNRWELDEGGVTFGTHGSQRTGRGPAGPHAGRGPRGYRRADERIHEDVCDGLTEAPDIDATEIEVEVGHGLVILSGTVDNRAAKRRAEDIAEAIRGVKDVENRLRLKTAGEGQGC